MPPPPLYAKNSCNKSKVKPPANEPNLRLTIADGTMELTIFWPAEVSQSSTEQCQLVLDSSIMPCVYCSYILRFAEQRVRQDIAVTTEVTEHDPLAA